MASNIAAAAGDQCCNRLALGSLAKRVRLILAGSIASAGKYGIVAGGANGIDQLRGRGHRWIEDDAGAVGHQMTCADSTPAVERSASST